MSTDIISNYQDYHLESYKFVGKSKTVELLLKSAIFDVFHRFFRHLDTAMMISKIF